MDIMEIGMIAGGVVLLLLVILICKPSRKEEKPKLTTAQPTQDLLADGENQGRIEPSMSSPDEIVSAKIEDVMPPMTSEMKAEVFSQDFSEHLKDPIDVVVPAEPLVRPLPVELPPQEAKIKIAPPGRFYSSADPLIECVVNFRPREGVFTTDRLVQIDMLIEQNGLTGQVRSDFYNAKTNSWLETFRDNNDCTEVNMSLLLANRSHCIDELSASRFIQLVNQVAIELNGEALVPDIDRIVEQAHQLMSLITEFDSSLVMNLVSDIPLDVETINEVCQAHSFVLQEGSYVLKDTSSNIPVFKVTQRATEPTKLELRLDLPFANTSSNWLGLYFSLANELANRLEAKLCDEAGHTVTSLTAALVSREIKNYSRVMREQRIPAGSVRAARVFSR